MLEIVSAEEHWLWDFAQFLSQSNATPRVYDSMLQKLEARGATLVEALGVERVMARFPWWLHDIEPPLHGAGFRTTEMIIYYDTLCFEAGGQTFFVSPYEIQTMLAKHMLGSIVV